MMPVACGAAANSATRRRAAAAPSSSSRSAWAAVRLRTISVPNTRGATSTRSRSAAKPARASSSSCVPGEASNVSGVVPANFPSSDTVTLRGVEVTSIRPPGARKPG